MPIVFILLSVIAVSARADISDSRNLALGGSAVIMDSATIVGNAFSIGGATFAVVGGDVGIHTASPSFPLHVVGRSVVTAPSGPALYLSNPGGVEELDFQNSTPGLGAGWAVFDSSGNRIATDLSYGLESLGGRVISADPGYSLYFKGTNVYIDDTQTLHANFGINASTLAVGGIVGNSSITASAFFGDGSHLSGISDACSGCVLEASTDTISGAKTFTSSSTFRSVGGEIVLSTSSTAGTYSVKVSTDGAVDTPGRVTANGVKYALFGGWYCAASGSSTGSNNPLTGGQSCPSGFTGTTMFSTGGIGNCSGQCISWSCTMCYRSP